MSFYAKCIMCVCASENIGQFSFDAVCFLLLMSFLFSYHCNCCWFGCFFLFFVIHTHTSIVVLRTNYSREMKAEYSYMGHIYTCRKIVAKCMFVEMFNKQTKWNKLLLLFLKWAYRKNIDGVCSEHGRAKTPIQKQKAQEFSLCIVYCYHFGFRHF